MPGPTFPAKAGRGLAAGLLRKIVPQAQASFNAVTPSPEGGELAVLSDQLGLSIDAQEQIEAATLLAAPRIRDASSLEAYLRVYQDRLLKQVELPAIQQAWRHASQYQPRELIALDRSLAAQPLFRPFARASLHAGRNILRRLRPMRDQRLVLRYLETIESGGAHGWHTVAFGISLSIFSVPLRQGLMTYGQRTLGAFATSAARGLDLTGPEIVQMLDRLTQDLPATVNALVAGDANPLFLPASPQAIGEA